MIKPRLIVVVIFVALGATWAAAQQSVMPSPPDVLTSQAQASVTLTSYKAWIESTLSTLWSNQQKDEAAISDLRTQVTGVLSGSTTFQVAACSFSGITGNIGTITKPSQDVDGGCSVGWNQQNERLIYTIYVPTAGSYALTARVTSGMSGGSFHVEINGQNVSGAMSVPNTGGWNNWTTIPGTTLMTLPSGIVTVSVVTDATFFDIHWLQLAKQ
jgi:Carbohydrate binding module (family 6)